MRRCIRCSGTGRILVPAIPPRSFTLEPEKLPPASRVELVRVDCPDCKPRAEGGPHDRVH